MLVDNYEFDRIKTIVSGLNKDRLDRKQPIFVLVVEAWITIKNDECDEIIKYNLGDGNEVMHKSLSYNDMMHVLHNLVGIEDLLRN